MTQLIPHFLIIGSQKSGTTSLYDALKTSPQFFLPSHKEPDILHKGETQKACQKLYNDHFHGAEPHQLLGEASTMYTMRPWFDDVSAISKSVCGSNLKLIMIMRDPVQRIISHLRHDYLTGRIQSENFDKIVFEHERFLALSDYAFQLKPWISVFGAKQLYCLAFEEFCDDPVNKATQVAKFLGADPSLISKRDAISNSADTLTSPRFGIVGQALSSLGRHSQLRRMVPPQVRTLAKTIARTKKKPPKAVLNDTTIAQITDSLSDMPEELFKLTGFRYDWDCFRAR